MIDFSGDMDSDTSWKDLFLSVVLFLKQNGRSLKLSIGSIQTQLTSSIILYKVIMNSPFMTCGPDLLPLFLLKEAADFTIFSLFKLFIQSIHTGCLPYDWVSANIVPVFKKNNRPLPSKYWPVR